MKSFCRYHRHIKSGKLLRDDTSSFGILINYCIGALDGKHIRINPPHKSGSHYYNYKHFFSLVFMAIMDADYRFIYSDIRCNGRISDGGAFKNCSIYSALETNQLNIPKHTTLPGSSETVPYVLVADAAFSFNSQTGLNTQRGYLTTGSRLSLTFLHSSSIESCRPKWRPIITRGWIP